MFVKICTIGKKNNLNIVNILTKKVFISKLYVYNYTNYQKVKICHAAKLIV